MLGLPDREAASMQALEARYSTFVLYPVLLRWAATNDEDKQQARVLGAPLVAKAPERFAESAWHWLSTVRLPQGRTDAFPTAVSWFVPPVPAGTAFEVSRRGLRNGFRSYAPTEQLRTWVEARPFDYWAHWSYRRRLVDGGAPAIEAARQAFGVLTEYDVAALRQLALQTRATTAERMATLERMCDISAFGCEDLAFAQVREGLDSKAATSFERWLAATPDAVHAANSSAWLARYYVHLGQFARAEALAREAGDTNSYRGLQVLGDFLDARQRDVEAEQVYRRMHQRYDRADALGAFLVRRGLRQNDRRQQQQGWELLKALFPDGGERLAWNTLTGPPVDGIVFETFGRRASARGLKRSDVIVGIDEWRVRTAAQYPILADLRHDETMTFTVWREGRYEQIHTHMRERWLGMELADYEPK
jgi:tetratricopeptide (TPR) repeat protein